jgi:hypothetical protein
MSDSKRRILIVLVLVLAGVLLATLAVRSVNDAHLRGAAMEDLPRLFPPESKELGQVVIKTYQEYRGNAVRWSAAYFGCVFGSAFFSALAGLLLKLEVLGSWPRLRNDLAASLAVLAALLVTLSTTGDFQRKWQANRIAAASMENLAYELLRSSVNRDAVVGQIQSINDARNKGIVGELTEGRSSESKGQLRPTKPHSEADMPPAPRR